MLVALRVRMRRMAAVVMMAHRHAEAGGQRRRSLQGHDQREADGEQSEQLQVHVPDSSASQLTFDAQRIAQMQSMVDTLEHLARHCHGDQRPECPILDDLAAPAS